MGIHITNSPDEYDHVFMSEQSIMQKIPEFEANAPEYIISLVWRRYKVNADDTLAFASEPPNTLYLEDFFSTAMLDYSNGEYALVTGLQGNEGAVARLLTLETDLVYEVSS